MKIKYLEEFEHNLWTAEKHKRRYVMIKATRDYKSGIITELVYNMCKHYYAFFLKWAKDFED